MEGRLEIWQIVYRNYFQMVFLLDDAFAGIFIYLSEELRTNLENCHVDHWNWTNGRFYQEGFPLQNIKTRHKTKHNEMGQEHFNKTITHSWQVGAKIMNQSKQVLKKIQLQTTKKEGRARFFRLYTRKIDTGLPALVVALCSNRSKCSDRNRMPYKRSWIAFPVVWMLFLPFRPQPLNREKLHFALCV